MCIHVHTYTLYKGMQPHMELRWLRLPLNFLNYLTNSCNLYLKKRGIHKSF